ncbi:MAG: Crp/Fnr family transcriptional regulator [Chlorobi bacterium]|nr:Crp/Fnr family transcriptional regulator [Chlorobiota bacterium]
MDAKQLIQQKFGHLFGEELIDTLANESLIFPVVKGQQIIKRGIPFNYMILVLSGTLKVTRTDEDGNEHVLFYLKEGDPCSETFTLCNDNTSEVDLIAEKDGIILMVPQKLMDPLMARYPEWRQFVLHKFGERIKEFLNTLDTITFKNLDERLWKYLRDKARISGSKEIQITHQDIARDLATSRVVISRLLKMFERQGKVKLGRNKIELLEE